MTKKKFDPNDLHGPAFEEDPPGGILDYFPHWRLAAMGVILISLGLRKPQAPKRRTKRPRKGRRKVKPPTPAAVAVADDLLKRPYKDKLKQKRKVKKKGGRK